MDTPLSEGQRVRMKPRTGTIERVKQTRIYPKGDGRHPIYSYQIRFDDGTVESLSPREIEAIDE